MTDSGDGLLHTVHIYEGYALHHAILRSAGRDLSEYAMKNPTERRYSFTPSADREIARNVKEKLCYIGFDYGTQLKSTAEIDKDKTFELSDGNINIYGAERFRCVNILFQPSLTQQRRQRIPRHFLSKCYVDTRKRLYADVVLSRGTTIFRGMIKRMPNELTALAPSTMRSRWLLRFGIKCFSDCLLLIREPAPARTDEFWYCM